MTLPDDMEAFKESHKLARNLRGDIHDELSTFFQHNRQTTAGSFSLWGEGTLDKKLVLAQLLKMSSVAQPLNLKP